MAGTALNAAGLAVCVPLHDTGATVIFAATTAFGVTALTELWILWRRRGRL